MCLVYNQHSLLTIAICIEQKVLQVLEKFLSASGVDGYRQFFEDLFQKLSLVHNRV